MFKASNQKNKEQITYLVMAHKKLEGFLLQVTRGSCFNLALIQLDCKLSISYFAQDD